MDIFGGLNKIACLSKIIQKNLKKKFKYAAYYGRSDSTSHGRPMDNIMVGNPASQICSSSLGNTLFFSSYAS
jgi:hypothetical protein